jgi:hypothetical protein
MEHFGDKALAMDEEDVSFDDHFDSGQNMKRRMQQGRQPRAVKTIPAGLRSAVDAEHPMRESFGGGFNFGQIPNAPPLQRIQSFASARQPDAPPRRSCKDIFRNIHNPERDPRWSQPIRGSTGYASRGGHNGGARLYDQSVFGQAERFDALNVGNQLQEQDAVISRSQAQAGHQPKSFMGPTAQRARNSY